MPLHPPGSDLTQTLDDDLEQIVTLDRLGYKEAWVGEHFTAMWENIPSPELFIAKAVGLTKNIVFGTGVTCMPNHNPFILAHSIAQLDHLAHGRLYWGVGAGGFPGDMVTAGMDPQTGDHRTMTYEALDLVLQIWDDPKPGLYESKYWRFSIPEPVGEIGLRLHMKPYQKPHPPIGLAGVSPKSDTLSLAGERGWIPLSINLIMPSALAGHWDAVEEGAKKAGRTPDRAMWRIARDIYVAETTEEAREEALNGTLGRDFADYWLKMGAHNNTLARWRSGPDMVDTDITVEYLLDNVMIVGSPQDVAQKLRDLYEDVGGFGVLLAMGHEWKPKDKWLRSMTLLKEDVMPRLDDLD